MQLDVTVSYQIDAENDVEAERIAKDITYAEQDAKIRKALRSTFYKYDIYNSTLTDNYGREV